jgi:long-subunit acyl-CoA synthetase (AMP-forming)
MRDLIDALHYRAGASGGMPAFDDGVARLSYAALAGRVAGAAEELRNLPSIGSTIGVLGGNQVDWVVAQLAGWCAGKIVVPLPTFFRVSQLQFLARDAGVSFILATADMVATARLLGIPFAPIPDRRAAVLPASGAGGQIVYTSGSTDRPKGVLLKSGQMMWTAEALARAIGATSDDSYLSALPLALLLETICAVMIPILVGARARLEPALAASLGEDAAFPISEAVARHRPSCMVLVPDLLARWTEQLAAARAKAPDALRCVAVGGAAVSPGLAQEARALGIPVYEGYGLTECGSVVALNRPGGRKPGTVGRPLPGLELRVEKGEIVVRGPSVMDGYLNGAEARNVWRTGDLGALDADGFLTVRGRRDNLIVLPTGRNVSPEWIESLIASDPRIAHCVVDHVEGPHLTAILVPTARGAQWLDETSGDEVRAMIAGRCREAPAYAIPRQFVVLAAAELARFGLFTGNGRIRRKALLASYAAMLRPPGRAPSPTACGSTIDDPA